MIDVLTVNHFFTHRLYIDHRPTEQGVFLGPFNPLLCVCSHSKNQNLYQVSYHSDEVKKDIYWIYFWLKMTEPQQTVKSSKAVNIHRWRASA